jgi:hypothetical protein
MQKLGTLLVALTLAVVVIATAVPNTAAAGGETQSISDKTRVFLNVRDCDLLPPDSAPSSRDVMALLRNLTKVDAVGAATSDRTANSFIMHVDERQVQHQGCWLVARGVLNAHAVLRAAARRGGQARLGFRERRAVAFTEADVENVDSFERIKHHAIEYARDQLRENWQRQQSGAHARRAVVLTEHTDRRTALKHVTLEIDDRVHLTGYVADRKSAQDVSAAMLEYLETVVNATGGPPAQTPWHLDRISAPLGDASFTIPANYNSLPQGIVYVLDTSLLPTHNEFLTAGAPPTRASIIYETFLGLPNGCNTHGTHVASIAAGTNVGACPTCRVYGITVLDCNGNGWFSGVLSGLNAVLDHCTNANYQGIVINMSLGGRSSDPSLRDALATVLNALRRDCDAVIVASAGNDGADACSYVPAAMVDFDAGHVLSVAATSFDDGYASFSNYGACVSLGAPGVEIYAAVSSGTNQYGYMTGTSMSGPLVAGVAAQHQRNRPEMWLSGVAMARHQHRTDQSMQAMALQFGTITHAHILTTSAKDQLSGVRAPAVTPNRLLLFSSALGMNYTEYAEKPPNNSDQSSFIQLPTTPQMLWSSVGSGASADPTDVLHESRVLSAFLIFAIGVLFAVVP